MSVMFGRYCESMNDGNTGEDGEDGFVAVVALGRRVQGQRGAGPPDQPVGLKMPGAKSNR